jgi:tRNA threonylcarbamoyladenosine biosynthesis protein TsaE
MTEEFRIISHSEDNTRAVARKIAPLFRAGDVIVLDGDLGAGKTCFVKGFTDGLHSDDAVNSPTFSIANFYRTGATEILHIDLYRISTVEELNDLGLSDYFGQSIALIEWGKKFAEFFEDYLLVSFEINDDHVRTITFTAQGDKYGILIDEMKKRLKGGESC